MDNCKIKNPKSSSGFTPLHAAASNGHLGAKYLVFSPLVPSKREKNVLVLLSLYLIFFEGSVFTFQFLNDKI